jgi:hypothetical protein
MKILLEYLEDVIFEERFTDYLMNGTTTAIPAYSYYGTDIIIYIKKSIKNLYYYEIPLLIHEYIHAILFILLGWNYKLRSIQKIFDYINETIWVLLRSIIKMVKDIIKNEKGYFNLYWK